MACFSRLLVAAIVSVSWLTLKRVEESQREQFGATYKKLKFGSQNRTCDKDVCLKCGSCFLIDSWGKGHYLLFLHVCLGKFYPLQWLFPKGDLWNASSTICSFKFIVFPFTQILKLCILIWLNGIIIK